MTDVEPEYDGLAIAVKQIAERHFERRTRHISRSDYHVLCSAAARLNELDRGDEQSAEVESNAP